MELLKHHKLLSILSSYADKSLENGVILYWTFWFEEPNYYQYYWTSNYWTVLRKTRTFSELVIIEQQNFKNFEIIWHITLSTVFKYILGFKTEKVINWGTNKKWLVNTYTLYFDKKNPENITIWKESKSLDGWYIINKPLHLYSKKELDNLYSLLVELQKKENTKLF